MTMTTEARSNYDRFLNAYTSIERELKRLAGSAHEQRFAELVRHAGQSNSAVRHYQEDLHELHDLRNAIVHDRRGGTPIADPNAWAVNKIESIAAVLQTPPKVYPKLTSTPETLKNWRSLLYP